MLLPWKKNYEEKNNNKGLYMLWINKKFRIRADSYYFPFMPQGLDTCSSGSASSAALTPKGTCLLLKEDLEEQDEEKKKRKERRGKEEGKQKPFLLSQEADSFGEE